MRKNVSFYKSGEKIHSRYFEKTVIQRWGQIFIESYELASVFFEISSVRNQKKIEDVSLDTLSDRQ